MELCGGFCRRGSGVRLGLRQAAGTKKTRERASQRERSVRKRSLDYLNHYKLVLNHSNISNHSVLLLFRERERGGPQAILFLRASLLFCACSIYFCCIFIAVRMTGHTGYKVTLS